MKSLQRKRMVTCQIQIHFFSLPNKFSVPVHFICLRTLLDVILSDFETFANYIFHLFEMSIFFLIWSYLLLVHR